MNDLTITVTGWVATDPKLVLTREENGTDMCSFRVAQTSRRFDRPTNEWVDVATEWFTVRVFRDAAHPVRRSIKTGQPVIVQGRLRTHEWATSAGEARWDLQIDATSVGHDLTKGVGDFQRATVASGSDARTDAPAEAGELDGDVTGELTEEQIAAALAEVDDDAVDESEAAGDDGELAAAR